MSVGSGAGWPGGSGSDLLACAADLRWARPDLVAEVAEHAAEIGSGDDHAWLDAVGWLVHGRSAVGDGRECATTALVELSRRSPDLWAEPAAARLRVEVALLAAAAGEPEMARDITNAVLAGPAPADVRADGFGVLARCMAEERPGSVDEPARRAEVAWAEVGGAHAEIGAAAVTLVAAAALRRAGRADTAVERAAEGLSRLDHVRGAHSGSPSRHLAAALAAEWIGSLLDAGRPDAAREGCGPLESRLREVARPSRQVALLRLTVARALAGHGESSVEEALLQAASDAAAADAPDLEAVCLSTLGALHEQAGRLESALDAVRRGVEAHRRDAARRDRFVAALHALPAPGPTTAAWTPSWDAEPSDSPIGDLVARTLGASPPVPSGRAPTPTDRDEPGMSSPLPPPSGSRHGATSKRHAGEPVSSGLPGVDAGPRDATAVASGRGGPSQRAGSRISDRDSRISDRDSRSSGPDSRSSGPDSRTSGPDSRTSGPDSRTSGPDSRMSATDSRIDVRSEADGRPHDGRAHDDTPARVDDDPLFGAFWRDPVGEEAAADPSPPRVDEPPPVNGSPPTPETAAHPLAGSPWSTGRWSSVRPRRDSVPSGEGGRRRQRVEPATPPPDTDPPPTPVASEMLSTESDGWLQAALAELDRVWGTSTGAAPPAADRVAGCVVVVDVVRAGEPVPARTHPVVASAIETVAGQLLGDLPAGARLRRDADTLSVVMPTHDHGEAGEWMHRVLPPVFAACVSGDDDARLAIRAAVHGVDGPVGAQLIQRLGATTSRRAAGRHDASAGVAFPPPLAGSGGRRRRVDPDDELGGAAHRGPSSRHGVEGGGSVPDLDPTSGGAGHRPATGAPGAGPRAGMPGDGVPGGDVPIGALLAGAQSSGGRAPEPSGSADPTEDGVAAHRGDVPAKDGDGIPPAPAGRAAPDAPAWIAGNTEGLGIADLLAGALAAYRSI